MAVSWGTRIRVFVLFVLGAIFFFPGVLVLIAGFMEPDITADDTLAMFVLGGGASLIGLLIWASIRKVYRRGRRRASYMRSEEDDGMAMGMGMAHMHHMAAMDNMDSDNADSSDVESDFDSGDDYDAGGDFDFDD